MKIFKQNEEAVSPVIGVILMVAITVILAAVIAAFVFGLGGSQQAAPTASIVASNNPDTSGPDMKIQHKGGDLLKGGEWKVSIVEVGNSPRYVTAISTNDLSVGAQITTTNLTIAGAIATAALTDGLLATNATVAWGQYAATTYVVTLTNSTAISTMASGTKYDVKLVHIPSNSMLLDQIVEVR